jgi:methylated-DNA-[protein]-cysteine S-methyltransferase
VGNVYVTLLANRLCRIEFAGQSYPLTDVVHPVLTALTEYFQGLRRSFADVDYLLSGTVFQYRVWQETCRIPFGERISYGKLAQRVSSAPRAVAQALRRNPIPIIVPCHRVVGACDIGGFGGQRRGIMLHIKQGLLQHETSVCA